MFLSFPSPALSPCLCWFAFSPLKPCGRSLWLTLPTSRSVPCCQRSFFSRRSDAWVLLGQLGRGVGGCDYPADLWLRKGRPDLLPQISRRGSAFLGELYVLGIVGFRGLVALPSSSKLRRGFDFGLRLPGGRPVSIEGVSSSCSSCLPPGLACWACSSASGFAFGVLGRE